MGQFVKGEVVVSPFPFSDLSNQKRRPALVIATLSGDDLILCQITSQNSPKDIYAIPITNNDFKQGQIKVASYIRPNRIFTGDSNIILYSVGHLKDSVFKSVVTSLIQIIKP